MGWTVYGDEWLSGDLANQDIYCPIKFNSNVVFRAFRTWIIVNNDPTFTNLTAQLWSDETGPKTKIADSTTTHTKAEIITADNGVKEVYFEFDDITCEGDTTYNLVLNGAGYVYASGSHLAWRKAFVDPVHSVTGVGVGIETLRAMPYMVTLIGAAL